MASGSYVSFTMIVYSDVTHVYIYVCIFIEQDTKDSTLMELIAQSEDRPMQLAVYNVKSQTTRGIITV